MLAGAVKLLAAAAALVSSSSYLARSFLIEGVGASKLDLFLCSLVYGSRKAFAVDGGLCIQKVNASST